MEVAFLAWQEPHPGIEVNYVENEGDTQSVPQGDTQGDSMLVAAIAVIGK